ncbi:MAG: acetoacetate decarboxylase family protein [Alcanivorax sp.]|nr:acetoacetate decarboxylase family protein [Alcanivorax sp.]
MQAPAPWQLTGNGFIATLRLPQPVRQTQGGYPASLPRPGGALCHVMFVDYHSSDVGPYRELLFLGGHFPFAHQQRRWSIGRIYVSSQDSVDNGRTNWGIPKALADFRVEQDGKQTRVSVSREGRTFARLAFQPLGPTLPINTALIPQRWRSLAQHWQNQTFYYTPEARGRAGLARHIQLWADGEHFPAMQEGRCLAGVAIRRFQMTFPRARIEAGLDNACLPDTQ